MPSNPPDIRDPSMMLVARYRSCVVLRRGAQAIRSCLLCSHAALFAQLDRPVVHIFDSKIMQSVAEAARHVHRRYSTEGRSWGEALPLPAEQSLGLGCRLRGCRSGGLGLGGRAGRTGSILGLVGGVRGCGRILCRREVLKGHVMCLSSVAAVWLLQLIWVRYLNNQ